MLYRRVVTVAALVACVALVSCEDSTAPKGGKIVRKGTGRAIGITFMTLANPFLQACKTSAAAVVEAKGDELIEVNAQRKSSLQLAGVENLIQAGVACILLNPVNSEAAEKAVVKANEAKIPVVTFDVNASGGDIACFVESNNYLAGQLCGDYVGQRLKGKGKIAIINHPEVASVKQRVAGFTDRLKKAYPGIEVVADQAAKGKRETAMAVTENILRAHGDELDAIFGINDPSALGAAQAVKAAKNIKIFIVGIDGAPDAIEEIRKNGPLALSVAQFPQQIGRVAAEMGYKVIAGETVPKHVKIPVMPVTRDNLDTYPGWEGEVPKAIEIPWKSDLKIAEETE